MSANAEYQSRLTSATEAIKSIKSGNRVVVGHAAAVPNVLLEALADHATDYENVEMVHMFTLGEGRYMTPGMEKHFRHNALFVGGNARKAVEEKRADFTPVFFHEVPKLFREGNMPVDVALVMVSRPNEEGYCSYGVSCDYSKPAVECAKVVIAEANDQMPFIAGGDNLVHVSKLTKIVEVSYPLFELPKGKIGDIEKAIGEHCASLIPDGATLQLGIGSIPDAVLLFLKVCPTQHVFRPRLWAIITRCSP